MIMNETIPCLKCRYGIDVIDVGEISHKCTKFNFEVKYPLENGCTFGKKRITNADKLKEVFGHSDPLLFNNIEETESVTLVKEWLQSIYEEPEK